MTPFSPAFASLADARARRIETAQAALDAVAGMPGLLIGISTYANYVQVQISDVDPQDVTDLLGPPQQVRRHEGRDHWSWLHPVGFTVVLVESA